jgi:hypothetical protein
VAALIGLSDALLGGAAKRGRGQRATPERNEPRTASLTALPLDFVANRGQWPRGVEFVAQRGSVAATFERDAVRLRLGYP